MISPEEIRKQALKWWLSLLTTTVRGEPYFPKEITRIGKIQTGDIVADFERLQQELERLYLSGKPKKTKGYSILLKSQSFRRTGTHALPDAISFDTLEDYLAFTGKQKEWDRFSENRKLILKTIPSLQPWMAQNPLPLTSDALDWVSVLLVCQYFLKTPRPNLYIRQLPIEVHTKFIEQHSTILSSLLDYLIPGDIRNAGEKRIDRRYYLRYDQPLIRIRVLDPLINILNLINTREQSVNDPEIQPGITDISIPLADFNKLKLSVKNVLITENKMNFLTLPELPAAISIWSGGGFLVSSLKEAAWLNHTRIFYWGDIDEHGFQILHQIRSYFPGTKSVMMDLPTLEAYTNYRGSGARNKAAFLSLLTTEEQQAFEALKASELNRLEQEKIDQGYAEVKLKELISNSN